MSIMLNLTIICYANARELLDAILTEAFGDGGKPIAACIVDATGKQLLAAAMDDVKTPSIGYAFAKAVTAVEQRRDTVEFEHSKDSYGNWLTEEQFKDPRRGVTLSEEPYNGWSTGDILAAIKNNTIFLHWAGGVMIRSPHDDAILGAIGVSGRRPLEDHKLASIRPSGWAA